MVRMERNDVDGEHRAGVARSPDTASNTDNASFLLPKIDEGRSAVTAGVARLKEKRRSNVFWGCRQVSALRWVDIDEAIFLHPRSTSLSKRKRREIESSRRLMFALAICALLMAGLMVVSHH
ncbi:MAG TPA: hypothetical protein EYH41_06680 [Novosphingobium capsulatum]|nr:hypothetical protein [Novosphingobium capsulatum]